MTVAVTRREPVGHKKNWSIKRVAAGDAVALSEGRENRRSTREVRYHDHAVTIGRSTSYYLRNRAHVNCFCGFFSPRRESLDEHTVQYYYCNYNNLKILFIVTVIVVFHVAALRILASVAAGGTILFNRRRRRRRRWRLLLRRRTQQQEDDIVDETPRRRGRFCPICGCRCSFFMFCFVVTGVVLS